VTLKKKKLRFHSWTRLAWNEPVWWRVRCVAAAGNCLTEQCRAFLTGSNPGGCLQAVGQAGMSSSEVGRRHPGLRRAGGGPSFRRGANLAPNLLGRTRMTWKTPKIVEVPVGMEINMYACAARK
jgi:coenzyme PQQ precursor peptide PqqA